MTKLEIMSLNTWKCDGLYPQRIKTIQQQLSSVDFDVLLLQEVFRSDDGVYDTLEELAHGSPGLNVLFHPCRKKKRQLNGHSLMSVSGLAIITRFNIEKSGAFQLPMDETDPERHCQWCVITTDQRDLLILNTHLTHIADQQDLRVKQFESLIAFIKSNQYSTAIIGGDMNTSPSQLVFNQDLDCIFTASFPNTLNSDTPQCLDHLYLYSTGQVSAHWGQYRLLLDERIAGSDYCSDHKALLGELFIA